MGQTGEWPRRNSMLQVEVVVLPIPRFRHVAMPKCPDAGLTDHSPLLYHAVPRKPAPRWRAYPHLPMLAMLDHPSSSVSRTGPRGPRSLPGGFVPNADVDGMVSLGCSLLEGNLVSSGTNCTFPLAAQADWDGIWGRKADNNSPEQTACPSPLSSPWRPCFPSFL